MIRHQSSELIPVAARPEPPLPMLVTGLTGVAGYHAFQYFRQLYPGQVIGIRQRSNWPLSGEGIVACDSESHSDMRALFERYRFQSVLNCAGNCALKSCELDPPMAWRINLLSLGNLLEFVVGTPIRLVHLSIDLVYSGTRGGGHVESDPTDPVTVYGKTMAASEELVMLAKPDACTLRISLPMGISYSGHAGAIDWIQSRFKQRKPATLYFDEVRTPTYTDCLNRVFHDVLTSGMSGLFNAGGPRRLSLFQIAQIVNRIGGYDPDHLQGCMRVEAGPMPPRAGNVTLDSSRLADELGYEPFTPWPYRDDYVPTDPRWHYERPQNEPGSPELLRRVLYTNPLKTLA